MPPGVRTQKNYLALNKSTGEIKRKVDGEWVYAPTWKGEIADFRFRDDEYEGEVKRNLEIDFREINQETGEEIIYQLQTTSTIFIEGFLSKVASLPSPGNAATENWVVIGAYKPEKKRYLYCFLQMGGVKIENFYGSEQRKSWFVDLMNKTDEERAIAFKRIAAAAVRWRRKHWGEERANIPWYNLDNQVKFQYDDAAYVEPEAGEPSQEPATTTQSTAGTSDHKAATGTLAAFVTAMKGSVSPHNFDPAAWLVQYAGDDGKLKADCLKVYEKYLGLYNRIKSHATPHIEADLLQRAEKGQGWKDSIDHIVRILVEQGHIEPAGGYEDDLPF